MSSCCSSVVASAVLCVKMIFLEKSSCVEDEACEVSVACASAASVLSVFFGCWSCVLREASGKMLVFSSVLGLQVVRPAVVPRALCEKCTFSLVKRSLFLDPCVVCVLLFLAVVVIYIYMLDELLGAM